MSRIVDLTLPFKTGMEGIPGIALYDDHPVRIQAGTCINDEQRDLLGREGVDMVDGIEATGHMNTLMHLNSHIGTHIDAPRHVFPDGNPIDLVPLEKLVNRNAIVLDVSDTEPGEGVTRDALERTGIKPTSEDVAVIKTLWTDKAWGTREFWSNTVWLDPSVSEWTMEHNITAVAMDCFPEKPFWRYSLTKKERGANHKRWLNGSTPMIQLISNLDSIGNSFKITALPLRLVGMDGSPARVIGIED